MLYNADDVANAKSTLARSGIVGEDAETSLRIVLKLASAGSYEQWQADLKAMTAEEVFTLFGNYAGRAAMAVRAGN